jgi:hypothetical protein
MVTCVARIQPQPSLVEERSLACLAEGRTITNSPPSRLVASPTRYGGAAFAGGRALAGLPSRSSPEGRAKAGVPNGIRTRVLALKGPRPRPLDDGDA